MNGTIGRGTAVHGITGDYANCGKGMGRNSITATAAPVDCKTCLKLTVEVEHTYRITYRKNSLARGWVTKTIEAPMTEAKALTVVKNLINLSGFQLLTSERIG